MGSVDERGFTLNPRLMRSPNGFSEWNIERRYRTGRFDRGAGYGADRNRSISRVTRSPASVAKRY
jgi:hypothetical protein